jgi:hypothetical protein
MDAAHKQGITWRELLFGTFAATCGCIYLFKVKVKNT